MLVLAPVTTTLASRVHELREAAKISQRELARLAGLKSERHVGLIENGERPNLEMKTFQGLARVLGATVGWLSAGEGERPSDDEVKSAVAIARADHAPTLDPEDEEATTPSASPGKAAAQ